MNIKALGLVVFLTLGYSTAVQAENYKTKMCIIAETGFWKSYKAAYDTADHSYVDILDAEGKKGYFNMHKGDLLQHKEEVSKRCKRMDKDILSAFENKMQEMERELAKLN